MSLKVLTLFVLSLILMPIFVYADCSKVGTTVIFVNGIFGDKKYAQEDTKKLAREYDLKGDAGSVNFINGFNESHLGKLDDLAASAIQAYTGGYLDHDLTDVLRQVHADLKTQKILLVGHSQGTFYTNAAYDYLVSHGVDKSAIAVYNVATPADRVAGDGKYLTSSTDGVISLIVKDLTSIGFARKPLPPNIDIKIPKDTPDPEDGHSFSSVYLGLVPDRIIGDMDEELSVLVADNNKSECFKQPDIDTMYRVFDGGYAFADGIGKYNNYAATSPYLPRQMASIANSLFQGTYNFGKKIVSGVAQIFSKANFFKASLASSPAQGIVSGSSTSAVNPSQQQISDSNAPDETGSGPDMATGSGSIPIIQESVQDQLDDIQEKLDLISQQVQILVAQQNPGFRLVAEEDNTPDDKKDQDQVNNQDDNTDNSQNNSNNSNNNNNTGGGSASYSKVLISEIQVSGVSDDKQEFVELYNPNNQNIDLTGWYLQRKTAESSSWSTYAPSGSFASKNIVANGYFLIARSGYYPGSADISTDNPITNDNSFALKSPDGSVSDKIGFGTAEDPESVATVNPGLGQSIGRKVLSSGAEQDFDNNLSDFELQNSTPRAQNVTYVAPIQAPPQALKNIMISEVQTAGITAKDEFIELYNPNAVDVNLSGFSLKKKTSGGTESNLVSSGSFLGTIPALGYFLIVPQDNDDGTKNYTGTATPDLYYSGKDYSIASNNTILLYSNDDTPVLLDKIGFGSAEDFESHPGTNPVTGQSIGRKAGEGCAEKDSDDNSADLEADTPTPKAQNVPFLPPVLSSGDAVTSAVYRVSDLVNGAGTITNIPYETSLASFESAIVPATGATLDISGVSDPVASGNKLVVTAQDGIAKATYTLTVNLTNLAQGLIDSFTPNGKFNLHTSDFMPNQGRSCVVSIDIFNNVYPDKSKEEGAGSGPCSSHYPFSPIDLSGEKASGEYDLYISYCGGDSCQSGYPVGDYYRLYFDGSSWSALPIDNTKTRLSDDVSLTAKNYFIVSLISATYTSGIFTGGTGTIINVRLGTSKSEFESAIVPATGATLDFSGLSDPIITGNTVKVTAQDGKTKSTYTITADKIQWSPGIISSYTPDGKFSFNTSFFTDSKFLSCGSYLYQSLYPFQTGALGVGSFPCGGNQGTNPVYNLNMSYFSAVGDYTNWMSDPSTGLGEYYEFHFDGSNWSPINASLSNDATVASSTYSVSPLSGGSGSITNVPFGTTKSVFESALTKNQANQTWDDSGIKDPVASGDSLVVTAQDGITKAVYAITVNAAADTTPPSIATYTATNNVISPNGDGVKDSTDIDWKFSEEVKVNVDIIDGSGAVIVKDFYKSDKVTNPRTKTWDGKNSTGSTVPDGIYTIKIIITDSSGNSTTDTSHTITVDDIAPIITLNGDSTINLAVGSDYVEPGAVTDDGSAVNITGSVDKNTAGSYSINYNATDGAGNQAVQVLRTVVVS